MKLCNTKKLLNVCKLNILNLGMAAIVILAAALLTKGALDCSKGCKEALEKDIERML